MTGATKFQQWLATLAALAVPLSVSVHAYSDEAMPELAVISTAPNELPIELSGPRGDEAIVLPTLYAPRNADIHYRSIIEPARVEGRSISMGNTSYGTLLSADSMELESPTHYVVDAHRGRNTHHGTIELVSLIRDTAHGLANRFPGTRLALGNMSGPGGGDIYWSRSHNSGRDADFAYFVSDTDGNPVEVPDLITMRSNGNARYHPGWQFDLERNWALIESLITSQAARVQWIFVYAPIRRQLLAYAEAHGVERALIERAAEILRQPSDSARHDDHFHVRVYCSFEDRLEGCVDWGPQWSHVAFNDDALDRRVRELIRGLMDPDPAVVQGCFDFIERLHPRPSALTIATAIPHQTEDAQLVLLALLESLNQQGVSGPLLPLAESGDSPQIRRRIFETIGTIGDQSAAASLVQIMDRNGQAIDDDLPLKLAAARALRHIDVSDEIELLLPMLVDENDDVRVAVSTALSRTTGFAPPSDVAETSGASVQQWWATWHQSHRAWTRQEWVRTAFEESGYEVGDLTADTNLPGLVEAIADGPPQLAYLADRLLNEHTRFWSPLDSWSRDDRLTFWREKVARR